VAKHPARCPRCGAALEVDTAVGEQIICSGCQAALSLPGESKLSDRVDPLIGQTLGEFEIVEILGRGGMGAVYKARQASLGRFVAIKVLPRRLAADASFVERFGREARSAAAIRHPNIIEVHAIGQDKGYQYIAMEFIDGETLADLLKREGRLPPDRALEVMKQVASALARAHASGILHRDIKPSNILIDTTGWVKVADFGLAKHEGADVSVTATGQALGTPLYMPPEVGQGKPADPRSDLYSLGATFYQAIAGKPPFDGVTPAEVMVKHVTAQAPPLQQLAPHAPPVLCRAIHRLLRKNPAERYESAEKLLEALNKVEARVAVDQAAATLAGPARPPTGRRDPVAAKRARLLLILGGSAAVVFLLALVVIRSRSGKQPSSAVGLPSTPTPTTQHPPPGPAAAAADRNAEIVFRNAQTVAARGEWEDAKAYLDRLQARYGDSGFVAAHRAEIDVLRAKAEAALRPAPPSPKPKPEKQPEPPKPAPEPAPEALAEARWKEIKEEAEKLAAAGDYEGAAKLLESAGVLKLKDIEERMTEAREGVAAAKREALDRALDAYAAESEKVWALFSDRKYPEAEALLKQLAADPRFRIVGGVSPPRETGPRRGDTPPTIGDMLKADQEASKLLREFWAAVERGLAAKKGDFIAFGGAGGKITEVKDGQVTVRGAGAAEFKLSVLKLGAKQALHYSGLKLEADPRSKLMAAVLFIADGTALDEAAEALDKAGDAPSVAIYRERLEALRMGVAEAAARKAWLRIGEAARGRLSPVSAERLAAMLAAFEKQHGQTKFHKGLGEQLATVKARIADSLGYTQWPFDAKEAKRRQKATAEALGVPIEQDVEIAKGVKMTFVLIPAGEFLMGSPPTTSPERLRKLYGAELEWLQHEFPQHRVKITKPFWLGKTEVTQEQWQAVMGTNPSQFAGRPQNPVETVNWHDCQQFLQTLSGKLKKTFRLPAEAEWEYACRAGAATEFHFGDDQARLRDYAWLKDNSGGRAHPVGSRKPNAWGLHDMAGNVWEWCEDWFGPYDKEAQKDPKGPPSGALRVLRGAGSWGGVDPAPFRCAYRHHGYGPSVRNSYSGFRASRTLDVTP